MIELFEVTAQYSNAVLVAILPQISDFAKKLELPVPLPITAHQVREFRCSPMDFDPGGLVIFTNGLRVWYHKGYVNGFRTPHSYYNLQNPRDIPRFYGPLKLNKDEALQFARDSILKLGFTLKGTFTDQEPEADLPPQIGTNIVPHYRFQWKNPVFRGTAVSVEVDAGRTILQEFRLSSPFFWRDPPKIATQPRPGGPKPAVTAMVSNEFLSATLPKISEFARKLELPFKFPVAQEQVERVAFVGFDWDVRIKLTNGYWFRSQKGSVAEFSAPDTVYGGQGADVDLQRRPVEEYLGEWKLGESEAIELVRQAIKKLGCTLEELNADRAPTSVSKPERVGKYVVPRYYFEWLTNDPETRGTVAMVRAEVDADKKLLKHLHLIGERFAPGAKTDGVFGRPILNTNRTLIRPLIFDTNSGAILPDPNAPQKLSHQELRQFLEKAGGSSTNKSQKPPTTVKPFNPFE